MTSQFLENVGTLGAGAWKISIRRGGWEPLPGTGEKLPESREGRRAFLKFTAAAMAAPLLFASPDSNARRRRAPDPTPEPEPEPTPVVLPPSPPTIPWVEELPSAITPLSPVSLNPAPALNANTAAGECGRAPHQRW